MKRFIFLSFSTALFCSAFALNVNTLPGSLAENLAEKFGNSSIEPELIIAGRGDIRDLKALRDLPADVTTLDLSGFTITEFNSTQSNLHLGKTYFRSGHLPEYVFFKAAFKEINLPKGVTVIEAGALSGSQITRITIPEGVTEIGDYAFYGCPNLETVILPSTLTKLGKGAFANCPALTSINIEASSILSIPERCFSGDAALSQLNASPVTFIGSEAFAGTSIATLNIPEARTLAPYALANMPNLKELFLDASANIGPGLLLNDSALIKIEGLPENVPDLFAANCSSLTMGEQLASATSIGKYSFINTPASEIILGGNLVSIDASAFKNAVALTHIDATALGSDYPQAEESSFANITPSSIKLKVADNDAVAAWKASPVWGNFDIYTDNNTGIDLIAAAADSTINITLDSSSLLISAVNPIAAGAVYDMQGATVATIPAGVTEYSIPLQSLPAGVLAVTVKTSESSKTVKIIL